MHHEIDLSLAEQAGFVFLRDSARWRLYINPSEILIANDVDSLHQVFERIEAHIQAGGEVAGYMAYEAGYALESRLFPLLAKRSGTLCWFGLYDRARIFDDLSTTDACETKLLRRFELSSTEAEYRESLKNIRSLIEAGEVYQINFTIRARLQIVQSPWELFATLLRRHPVPYAAFLNTGEAEIVSLSPELFFEIEHGRITVKPMKGTAARGRTPEEDSIAECRLLNSEKNRAENVMIVDLMRNDLGRICRNGSIATTSLFNAERYPSVWQLTSTVEGELSQKCCIWSIFHALFPSGSVTGAPKICSMEHISRLEDSPRGVYTGAIGFFTRDRARFNVAIRTLELNQRHGTMGIGSGIVYDSKPQSEWEECHSKVAFLLQSQPEFKLIETLYWNQEYRFLTEHLARMRASAEYFDFKFLESEVRSTLRNIAAQFSETPKRVRILLLKNGEIEVTHSDFVAAHFGQVGISTKTVSSQDRFLFHKTTNRDLYSQELAAARRKQLDDVLFFNENGELTESAIHNVFVVKNDRWRTPPIQCGLLPGTYRAHVLSTHPNACESILRMDDLLDADGVYLCNSVQGIFEVKLVCDAKIPVEKMQFNIEVKV